MIDIETDVIDIVARHVKQFYPSLYTPSEYVQRPPSFPCMMIREMSNTTLARTVSSNSAENHASVMFEVDIFSVKRIGKKAECKHISNLADEMMLRLGFTRTMLEPIDNTLDASVYRIKGRYTAVVSNDKTIYGR